jgi:hypothetical protein
MRFRHPAWEPVAWVLAALNVASVWFAAAPGEPLHATAHAVLAVACAAGAQALRARRRAELADADLLGVLEDAEQADTMLDGVQARVQELEAQLVMAERLLAERRRDDQGNPPRPMDAGTT